RFRFQVDQAPIFSGEGFTVEKLSEPEEKEEVVNGVPYSVYSFKTAITPVKIGEMEVAPAEMRCGVVVPSRRGGMDDFFGDLFGGNSPFGNEMRELKIRSNSAKLEVKPLPQEGRPADFSGAIGNFTMEGGVSPAQTKAGEPITLSYTIRGSGNFANVGAPKLSDDEGWKVYPGKSDFTAGDVIGFQGTKRFDMTLVSRTDQTTTPKAGFSYFDPTIEKYKTLEAAPLPVVVTGGDKKMSAPVVAGGAEKSTEEKDEKMSVEAKEKEALAVPMREFSLAKFQPLLKNRTFLLANAGVAAVWLILLGFVSVGVWRRSDAGARSKERKARRAVIRRMSSKSIEQAEFYQMAYDLFQSMKNTTSPDFERARVLAQKRRDEKVFGKISHIPKAIFEEEKAAILSAFRQEDKS
ncbi:MAG: hypothetical protein ACK5LK_09460, partial [Chthoniobacterales bacterium]